MAEMQFHGGEHGFTELLLSMGVPCLDWPMLDRLDAVHTDVERRSPSRSLESGRSRSSGDFHGGNRDGFSPGEWNGSSDLFESPPLLGSGKQSSHGSEEELSTPDSTHAQSHNSDQSTHTSHKRPYDLEAEDDPLVVPSPCSPASLKDPDTWVKRPRFGEIPDFRTAKNGRKSTLELKLRKFGDRKAVEIVEPEPGMEFDSLPEAFDLFNLYSWEVGFGIRYGASRRNKQGSLTMQEIMCGCAGSPRHDKTRSSACGCKAMIRLRSTDDHGWYIHVFRKNHNHSMSVSCGEKMQWTSHKNIDPHTKSLVRNLRDNNVGLSQVYTVIGSFFGSMDNVPFNKRSLRSLCASISKDHSNDVVRKTYELFLEMKKIDPNFVDSCQIDKDGRIRALMWTSGKSRMQYKHFGDAITFDTTYQTNQYEMPFRLFVGVNNHFQSIILGGYNKLQFQRDEDENFEEKHRRLGRVLLNSGGTIEKHSSKIYTPNVYNLFEVQLFQSASYTAQEIIRCSRYVVVHFDAEKRERWSRGSFEVRLDGERDYFQCDCGMYEHMGIICSHVFRVMSFLGRTMIPEAHVMQRWTKNACRDLPEHLRIYQKRHPINAFN